MATRMAVSRALERSRIFLMSLCPYFKAPARSAWPGLGLVTGGIDPACSASADMPSCQFFQSLFSMRRDMGEPMVFPHLTPEIISAWSLSIFILPPRPYPICLLLSSLSMSSGDRESPDGIPSRMPVNPLPWDSPAVRNLSLFMMFLR